MPFGRRGSIGMKLDHPAVIWPGFCREAITNRLMISREMVSHPRKQTMVFWFHASSCCGFVLLNAIAAFYYIICSEFSFCCNRLRQLVHPAMDIGTRPNCPVARAAELVGDKWSLLILRNLFLDGPQRFQDFANALEGVNPTTLSKRLKALQKSQLVHRIVIDSHTPRTRYELTALGRNLAPTIEALRDFGRLIP